MGDHGTYCTEIYKYRILRLETVSQVAVEHGQQRWSLHPEEGAELAGEVQGEDAHAVEEAGTPQPVPKSIKLA